MLQFPASPQNIGSERGGGPQGPSVALQSAADFSASVNLMHPPRGSSGAGGGSSNGNNSTSGGNVERNSSGNSAGANQNLNNGSCSTSGQQTSVITGGSLSVSSSSSGSSGIGSGGGSSTNSLLSKAVQTELTGLRLAENEAQATSDVETRNSRIEELNRSNEELRHQVSSQQRVIEQQKAHINRCIEVSEHKATISRFVDVSPKPLFTIFSVM